jgi:hypothetical protein
MCVTVTFVQTAPHYFLLSSWVSSFPVHWCIVKPEMSIVFLLGVFLNSMQVDWNLKYRKFSVLMERSSVLRCFSHLSVGKAHGIQHGSWTRTSHIHWKCDLDSSDHWKKIVKEIGRPWLLCITMVPPTWKSKCMRIEFWLLVVIFLQWFDVLDIANSNGIMMHSGQTTEGFDFFPSLQSTKLNKLPQEHWIKPNQVCCFQTTAMECDLILCSLQSKHQVCFVL